jgi:hypothetical protein
MSNTPQPEVQRTPTWVEAWSNALRTLGVASRLPASSYDVFFRLIDNEPKELRRAIGESAILRLAERLAESHEGIPNSTAAMPKEMTDMAYVATNLAWVLGGRSKLPADRALGDAITAAAIAVLHRFRADDREVSRPGRHSVLLRELAESDPVTPRVSIGPDVRPATRVPVPQRRARCPGCLQPRSSCCCLPDGAMTQGTRRTAVAPDIPARRQAAAAPREPTNNAVRTSEDVDIDESEDEGNVAHQFVDPEIAFTEYDVTSWATFISGSAGPLAVHILEEKLARAYGVHGGASVRRKQIFGSLIEWTRAAAEYEAWESSPFLRVGEAILLTLRDQISEEKKSDVVAIHRELIPDIHPGDRYGAALAKVESKSRSAQPNKRRRIQCNACGKFGHVAAKCFATHPNVGGGAANKGGQAK